MDGGGSLGLVLWCRRVGALVAVVLLATSLGLVGAVGSARAAGVTSTSPATELPGSTNPFSPGVPLSSGGATTTSPTATVAPTSTSSSGGGFSGTDAIIVAAVAAVLLGGIAVYIVVDSRSRTRTAGRRGRGARKAAAEIDDPFADRKAGSKTPHKSRKLSAQERRRRKRGQAPRRR